MESLDLSTLRRENEIWTAYIGLQSLKRKTSRLIKVYFLHDVKHCDEKEKMN